MKRVRRLFLDIETSPNIGLFWRPGYNLNLTPENIIKERAIICAGWKWEGEKKVHVMTWDAEQSDRKLVVKLAALLHEAGEVVAHNGDRFDVRWIRGRALKHGVSISPHITTVDTLKISRKYFELNSHRLNYLGQYLGLGGKIDTGRLGGLELWKRVLIANDREALADMVRYNRRDVQLLSEVYAKLNTYFPAKTRVDSDMRLCPSCGARSMIVRGYQYSAAGRKSARMQCKECGKYHSMPASKM